jgi:hypothetical protein
VPALRTGRETWQTKIKVVEAVNQAAAKAVANRADSPAMTVRAAAKKQAVVGVRKAAAVRKAVALVAAIVKAILHCATPMRAGSEELALVTTGRVDVLFDA